MFSCTSFNIGQLKLINLINSYLKGQHHLLSVNVPSVVYYNVMESTPKKSGIAIQSSAPLYAQKNHNHATSNNEHVHAHANEIEKEVMYNSWSLENLIYIYYDNRSIHKHQ